MIITAMRRAFVLPSDRIEMELSGPNGEVTLEFTPDHLDVFVSKAVQLIREARSHTPTIAGHFSVQAVAAAEATAHAPLGGQRVVLSIVAKNQVPYHFSLLPEMSITLRQKLQEAEEKAGEDARQTRQ